MKIKTIKTSPELKEKTVFLRLDLNVPIVKGRVSDDSKIIAALPTIRFLLRYQNKVIIATHLGRPKKRGDKEFSTKPLVAHLKKLSGKKVYFSPDCKGRETKEIIKGAKFGEIVLLENLRYYPAEEKNEQSFAKSLASLADVYVNDAFAVCHREHASVAAIKEFLPFYGGLLLEAELENLNKVLQATNSLVIVGGSKIKTKAPLLKRLNSKASKILVGGALANNFLKAKGVEVGRSLIDDETVKFAKRFKSPKIVLPIDVLTSKTTLEQLKNAKKVEVQIKGIKEIDKEDVIYDIGPKTMKLFSDHIKKAKTIIWNGPMGFYEHKNFKHGSLVLGRVVSARSSGRAFGLIGGGETLEVAKMTGMIGYIDWVSTGGGAMLAYLGGEKMPGLKGIITKK